MAGSSCRRPRRVVVEQACQRGRAGAEEGGDYYRRPRTRAQVWCRVEPRPAVDCAHAKMSPWKRDSVMSTYRLSGDVEGEMSPGRPSPLKHARSFARIVLFGG